MANTLGIDATRLRREHRGRSTERRGSGLEDLAPGHPPRIPRAIGRSSRRSLGARGAARSMRRIGWRVELNPEHGGGGDNRAGHDRARDDGRDQRPDAQPPHLGGLPHAGLARRVQGADRRDGERHQRRRPGGDVRQGEGSARPVRHRLLHRGLVRELRERQPLPRDRRDTGTEHQDDLRRLPLARRDLRRRQELRDPLQLG